MVTTTTGTIKLLGLQTKRAYNLSFYIADVIGTDIKFSQDGAATAASPAFYNTPEPVTIADMAIISGPTVMTLLKVKVNDCPTGQQILIATQYTSVATRLSPGISIRGGQKLTMTEA